MGHNHVTDNINCIITYFEPTKTALSISLTCQNRLLSSDNSNSFISSPLLG